MRSALFPDRLLVKKGVRAFNRKLRRFVTNRHWVAGTDKCLSTAIGIEVAKRYNSRYERGQLTIEKIYK